MSSEFDSQNLISIFVLEASDGLDVLSTALHPSDGAVPTPQELADQYIVAHRICGAAALYGFSGVAQLAEYLETLLEQAAPIPTAQWDRAVDAMRNITQSLQVIVRAIGQGGVENAEAIARCWASIRQQQEGERDGAATSMSSAPTVSEDYLLLRLDAEILSDRHLIPDLDPEVLSYFIPEAQEYLEQLEADLLRLDKDPQNKELINQLFRSAHTLKGSAYTVGFQSIGDLVHHVEDFMGAVRDGSLRVLPGHTDLILRAIDVGRILLRRDLSKVEDTRRRFDAARTELKRLDQGADIGATPTQQPKDLSGSATAGQSGSDEYRGQNERVPPENSGEEREVIRVSYARLERLMNLVGELVIGRGRLEQRLRALEQRSQQVLVFKSRLVDSVESFADKHTFTYQEAPSSSTAPAGPGLPAFGDFGSLELDKYDDFNILARRIGEVTADISESMSQLNGSIQKAHDEMSHLQQLTLLMRDEITRARMVPIGTPFTRFRRAVREIARASNKEVSLVTSGEQTEVDTGIVERLVDPLVHLVRNAVYHGIEPAADRIAKGKHDVGTVYLHAAHRGNSVIIEVEDDGAGLDLSKIRAKAIQIGLAHPHRIQAMSDADVLQLIFKPGFSTVDKVGDQAGRGVGLDVVKRVIEGINGHIDVESELGIGTKFTLNLPLTLLIATALLVRAGTEKYAIPLLSIQEVTMPTPSSVREDGDRTLLQIDEQIIELHSLYHILRREAGNVEWTTPVVIVRTAGAPMGLAVDELLGRQEIVIKPLGPLKPLKHSFFGGATIDPEGRVVLVIDPGRLASRGTKKSDAQVLSSKVPEQSVPHEMLSNEPHEARLLLIDDSLSIRKFVGRMLVSAGYPFDTAVDGEDGLRKASTTHYRMILTDLEMPKLNGFEVIQALRSRPETRHTPVVVMTTRARDKHRQMAMNLGADSYLPKPVEERMLLKEVERWLGKASALRKSPCGNIRID